MFQWRNSQNLSILKTSPLENDINHKSLENVKTKKDICTYKKTLQRWALLVQGRSWSLEAWRMELG
jgi:hypothetical protein